MNEKIGVVGLGVLGEAIAINLVREGVGVVGHDIDAGAMERARRGGIEVVAGLGDLTEAVEIAITCVPNGAALADVIEGGQGILAAPGRLKTIIEVSTLALQDKEAMQARCNEAGLRMLDCPVSGNRAMALKKGLTAFCSGARDEFEAVEPVLQLFCRTVQFVGAFGNGTKTKLAGNILNLVHNAVAAEVLVLAMKSGLDPEVFHNAIAGSASSSAMFEARGRLMVADDYDGDGQNFSIPMKDARTIIEHAAVHGCPTPIYQAALQLYHSAVAQGLGHLDPAAVCRTVEKAANFSRSR